MTNLDERLGRLEARIADAEGRIRALRQENSRLRAALGEATDEEDARGHGADARPMRLAILEAERQEIQSRLRNLLEAL